MSVRLYRTLLALGRLVGVTLVLFGIVAMHQLAGGEHMADGMSTGPMRMPTAAMPTAAMPTEWAVAPVAANAQHASGRAVPPDGSYATAPHLVDATTPLAQARGRVDELSVAAAAAGHGAMPTCLAVLASLLIVLTSRRTLTLPGAPRPALLRQPVTSPPGRGPPRALLAQICVLRT